MKEGEKGLPEGRKEKEKGGKRKRKRKLRRFLSFFLPLSACRSLSILSPPVATSCPLQPPPSAGVPGPRLPGGGRAGGLWLPLAPVSKWRGNFPVPRPSIPRRRRIPSPVSVLPKGSVSPLFFPNPNSAAGPPVALAGCPPGGRTNPSASPGF